MKENHDQILAMSIRNNFLLIILFSYLTYLIFSYSEFKI